MYEYSIIMQYFKVRIYFQMIYDVPYLIVGIFAFIWKSIFRNPKQFIEIPFSSR